MRFALRNKTKLINAFGEAIRMRDDITAYL